MEAENVIDEKRGLSVADSLECEILLKSGYTLIMVARIDFQTGSSEKHRRQHLNLRSPVKDQISEFSARMTEYNDFAGTRVWLYVYPPKEKDQISPGQGVKLPDVWARTGPKYRKIFKVANAERIER